MDASDLIALYGAGLATALAVFQYKQWRKSEDPLVVTISSEFRLPGHMEAVITNTQQSDVYIDFVGIGYRYRRWIEPWRSSFDELPSMKACEDGCLSGRGAGGLLKPGHMMEVYFEASDFRKLDKPLSRKGFSRRLCIWIDHSRADRTLCKAVS
jgi:hypothetical protein